MKSNKVEILKPFNFPLEPFQESCFFLFFEVNIWFDCFEILNFANSHKMIEKIVQQDLSSPVVESVKDKCTYTHLNSTLTHQNHFGVLASV